MAETVEMMVERLQQGEKIEFKCHQVSQGLISSNVMQNKKLKISLNGDIYIFENSPKSEE